MYSIVMLTAMSAGADVTPPPMVAPPALTAPGFTTGCHGVPYLASCMGSCYGSCYGSCHGSCHGGFFHRHKHKHSCSGYNCFSSCMGSCYGSCHGYSGISYGSSWGPPVGMLPYTLHGYNSGVTPVYGPGWPVVGANLADPHAVYGKTYYPNQAPVMTIPVAPMTKPSSDAPPGANLKFKVPADAKLYVDGQLAPGSGTERAFYTPALERGKEFFYEVYTERMVDGKLVATDKKKIIVESGKTITVDFEELTTSTSNIVRK